MNPNHTPLKPGRKRSQDQTQTPSTPTSTETATASASASPSRSPCSPNKQRKQTPSELTVLYFNAVAVVIMAVNAYP